MSKRFDLSRSLDRLTPHQRVLLEKLLQKEGLTVSHFPISPQSGDRTALPLSFAQQRLWFFDQWEPGSAVYNIAMVKRLTGLLDRAALEQSLNEIIKRHEILRTTFPTLEGEAIQKIAPALRLCLPVVDLTSIAAPEREAEVQRLAQEEAHRPFDLAHGPLIRAYLLHVNETEHIFFFTSHHIVFDGWSSGVFYHELSLFYNSIIRGTHPPLARLPIQYADYACWQRTWLQNEVLETQLAYWKQRLGDIPAVLELPTDRPRAAVQTFQGAIYTFTISQELSEKLKALSQQENATLFMTLLAGFNMLLSRYTGQEDIAVGTSIANRPREEFEGLVGLFINTLVLRTDLTENPSFRALLARVREAALSAYDHQDLPFEQLVNALQPERDLSHTPLFQVMFELQNTPRSSLELSGLTVASLELTGKVALFDLTWIMVDTRHGLQGTIEYNTDLFYPTTIARMAEHFQNLLQEAATNPDWPVSRLSLLSEQEKYQLLVEWNATTPAHPQEKCFHQLFENQVCRTPDSIAVVHEELQASYLYLNQIANNLSRSLVEHGVRPEGVVAVFMERGIGFLTIMLAIFKAGAAYLPLDPHYSAEYLSQVLAKSRASLVLTEKSSQAMLTQIKKGSPEELLPVLRIEDLLQDERASDNLVCRTMPNSLTYVIYTSGSTGLPKGAMIEQQGMLNHLCAKITDLKLTGTDRLAQTASQSFDISVWQFLVALLVGGQVHIISQEIMHDPRRLLEQIRIQGITILETVPSLQQALLEETTAIAAQPTLRWMVSTGEALPTNIAERWLKKYPHISLANVYGPTECSDDVTFYLVENFPNDQPMYVPLGGPISGMRLYVLDSQFQPVPVGVVGEVYISGVGVGRGYRYEPAKTAEIFLPHPYGQAAGERLYRTGDLGRYRPDGNIEFSGRVDYQVKVRGFRIEPGEIEAILVQHPAVKAGLVLARESVSKTKQLVAYVLVDKETTPSISELRSFLQQKLPEYMVPAAFVLLEQWPLTANGKVDRKRLPAPESTQVKSEQTFQPPLTPTEKMLAAIWSQVLAIEQVGIQDDFFELGGDSILSIRIIAKAQAAGLPLTPKQLFQHKTIAELAAQIKEPEPPAMQAEQGLVTGPVPLTPIQQWFFERDLPERHYYNQTMLLEIPHDQIDLFLLQQTVQALLTQHDALRLRYQLGSQGWEQSNAGLSNRVPFSFIDLTVYPETERAAVFESTARELQASLKLVSGLLMRVALFSFGADRPARLLMIIHHLAVDIISWQILLKDFQTAYTQLCRGEAIQLPRKTTAFKQWAEQLSAYAQSQSLRQELGYWLNQPWSAVTPLPVDSKGDNSEASSQNLSITLSIDETLALLRDVPKIYHTQMSEVLLTALLLAIASWTGKQTLLVELESHGREDIIENVDLSRTLGWFTSLVPVLLTAKTIEGGPRGTLKVVKEQLRSIPNGGIGFGLLRYLSRDSLVKKQLQALPQAEVLFNYQGQAVQPVHNDTLFKPSYSFSGSPISLREARSHLLEVYGALKSGRLSITLRYSDKIHQRATIEHLAVLYREALQKIIASCQSPAPSKSTPSALPQANLTPKKLNAFSDPLPEIGSRRQNIEASYPLSPLQQGMLFQTLYDAVPGIYCIQLNLMIDGELDALAFRRAWKQLIQRHAILRTYFAWKDLEEPLQLSLQHFAMPWIEQDWQGLSEREQQEQLRHFLQEDRMRGFELIQSPPVRVTLFRLATASYRCVFSFHHIVLDGWSVPLLLNELFAFYNAYSQGQQFELEPARPYRDYISWLQQQDQKQAELFWRQLLKGFTAPVALKIDQPSAKSTRHEAGADRTVPSITFSAEMTAALRTLAQQQQLTVNTLVQGTWALLLSRHSREEDIVFGAAVAGRPAELAGVETMIGMFVNTLPVRIQVSPQARLLPWLKELQMQQVEARQYEYLSLTQIKGLSDVPRELPLFESIVVFENYTSFAHVRKQSGQIQIKMEQDSGQTTYALYLEVGLGTNELSLRIIYDHQRFEATTISRMLGHIQVVLESIVTNPQQRLGNLPILTADERRQILVEWQDTYAHYPQKLCLHQLFEAQARQTPAKIAVVYQDECLTYQELNNCANRLAYYLQKLGVGPEKRVGICVQRSLTMMICLLGVLKAGAAYVPLDPDYPSERLSFVFQNAQAQVLLAQQNLADRFSTQGAHRIAIDTSWEVITKEAQENPSSDVLPENLTYIIYTSGSTGSPKGVQITHSAIVNLLSSMRHEPGLTEQDTLLAVTTFSFDMAGVDLFLPLIVGARLTLASQEVIGDAQQLCSQLATSGATVMQATPVTWRLLFEIGWQGDKELKVLCGGEALPAALGKQLSGCCASLWNMYGPTETTIWSAIRHIDEADNTPSIGRPIANTQIYLLDPSLQPVPVGVVGELYIGGSGLSRGYFNLPDMSAEKFIPDPFVGTSRDQSGSHDQSGSYGASAPGARLYKTGDLARFLPDGQIEFLGRSDSQVKIRGFRIELGEIEVALSRHPAVDGCAVVVHEKTPDHRQLVAYVIAQPNQLPEVSSLRAFLSTQLPNYMIPAHFRLLEEFPLTPNGKLDRRALSILTDKDEIEHSTRKARSRPRTILELQLIQIWENILHVHPISPDDNFFSLGGHSLLAARLMMQIQKQFGQTLPLSLLIQNGTVQHLAEILQQQAPIPLSPLVAIQPRGGRRPFFCVHPGSGNVLCYYELAHHLHTDQPFYGLQDPDIYRKDFPYIPVEDTASRYIAAIQAVQAAGPYLLGGYSFGGVVAFEMAQQLKRQGHSVALVAIIDGGTPGSSQSFKENDDAAFLAVITMELTRGAAKKSLLGLYEELQQYELAEQLQYVLEQMRLAGHEAPEGGPDWVYHEMQIFKIRSQAIEHYHPSIYQGTLTFFQSTELDVSGELTPLDDDWQPFSTKPLETYLVPGYHDTILNDPHVQVLAEYMQNCLDKAQGLH